jgi:hypothetical protein
MFTKLIHQEAFARDGSHRDLYVRSTSLNDWHSFLKFVDSSRYRHTCQINGTPSRVPSEVTRLFSADTGALLQIHLGGVTLNCHFFRVDEIELDLDPEELTHDDDCSSADAILVFMARLGQKLKKPVRMTAENARDDVIVEYDPATNQVTYKPPSEASAALTVRVPEDVAEGLRSSPSASQSRDSATIRDGGAN